MKFGRAVVVLQEDFVRKIMARPGDRDYRGISALAQIAFDVKILGRIERKSFSPPPRVNSMIVSFMPRRRVSRTEITNIVRLFTLRRRQVESVLAELGIQRKTGYGRRRVYELRPDRSLRALSPERDEVRPLSLDDEGGLCYREGYPSPLSSPGAL